MTSPSEATYPFKQARNFRRGRAGKIKGAVIHCTATQESAKGNGAENIQNYFATTDRDASAHVTVDQNSFARSVHDWDTAYGAAHFNAEWLHLEIVGDPNQSKAQWLDGISKPTLLNGAKVLADWSKRYGIDLRYLTVPQLRADQGDGFTFHVDCDKAKNSTGHWDPGPNFPRADFLGMVQDAVRPLPPRAPRQNPYLYAVETPALIWRTNGTEAQIRFVQWAMGYPVDGKWTTDLESAIRRLQDKHGRPVTGRVGDPGESGNWTLAFLKGITR